MIIYVEDNANNQRLMRRMLGKRGYEVVVYDTAEDGFAGVKEHDPELVFVDVHLRSRSTGLDMVRWMRKEGIETPVVVVTVFNMVADRKKALDIGCNDYLSKPYTMSDLFHIIDQYVEAPAEEANTEQSLL